MSCVIHWSDFNVDPTPVNIYKEMFRITQVPPKTTAVEFLNIILKEKANCDEIQSHIIDFCVSVVVYKMSKKINEPEAIQKLKNCMKNSWESLVDTINNLKNNE